MSPRAVVSLVLLACSLQGCALYAALDDSDAQDPDDVELGAVDMPSGDMASDMPPVDMPGDMPPDMPPVDMPPDMPPLDMPPDMPPIDMPPDMMNMGVYETLSACQDACRDPQRQCIREEGKPYVCIPTSEAEQRCLSLMPLSSVQVTMLPSAFVPPATQVAQHTDGALVFITGMASALLVQPATGLSANISHSELASALGDPVRAEVLTPIDLTTSKQYLTMGRPTPRNAEQGNLFGQRVEITATEPRLRGDLKWSHSGQTALCADFTSRILPYTNSAANIGRGDTMLLGLFCNTSAGAARPHFELEGRVITENQLTAQQVSVSHEAKNELSNTWQFPNLTQLRDITTGDNKFYLLSVDERVGQNDPILRLTSGEWLGSPMDPINLFASLDLDTALHAPRADQGFGRDGCGGVSSRLIYNPQERGLLRLSADGKQIVFAVPFQLFPGGNAQEQLRRWVIATLPTNTTNLAQDMRLRCVSEPAKLDLREVMDLAMAPMGPLALALVQEQAPDGKPTAVFIVPSSPGDNAVQRILTSRNMPANGLPPAAYYAQRILARKQGGYSVIGYQATPSAAAVFEMIVGADGAPICRPASMMPN